MPEGRGHRCANGTFVYRDPTGTMVIMADGQVVWGRPHDTAEYEQRALDMGYEDGTAMCRDHDPLHALLADWMGLPESYSLRQSVDPRPERAELAALEEAAVLAVQRFLKAAGRELPL